MNETRPTVIIEIACPRCGETYPIQMSEEYIGTFQCSSCRRIFGVHDFLRWHEGVLYAKGKLDD